MKKIIFTLLLAATSAFAQSGADQSYLLSFANLNTGAKTYYSHVRLTNLTSHELSISATFIPAGQTDNDPAYPLSIEHGNVIRLAPHQIGFEPSGFAEKLTAQGIGIVVFNAYRTDVAPWLQHDQTSNDLESSFLVETEVEIAVNGKSGTHRQTVNGIPWFDYASSDYPGRDRLEIDAVREDGVTHFSIYIANASQYSRTTVLLTLYDRFGVRQGGISDTLGPLESAIVNVAQYFPVFAINRANRLPPLDSPYFVIEQTNSVKVTEGCPVGDACPAFLALGVMTLPSGAAMTIPAHWLIPDQSKQLAQSAVQRTVLAMALRTDALASLTANALAMKQGADDAALYYLYRSRLLACRGVNVGLAESQARKMIGGEAPAITERDVENDRKRGN